MTMNHALDGELSGGVHVMAVRIYYEDTDFAGIVYHANYLRYMERGRTNFLRFAGADQSALSQSGGGEHGAFFVLRSMTLEFLKSARMDDVIEIRTMVEEVRGASLAMRQYVMRGEETLVEADVLVAFVMAGRAVAIPKRLREAIKRHAR